MMFIYELEHLPVSLSTQIEVLSTVLMNTKISQKSMYSPATYPVRITAGQSPKESFWENKMRMDLLERI